MSVFAPARMKRAPSKVHFSEYLRTENKPDEPETKPAEQPAAPGTPKAE